MYGNLCSAGRNFHFFAVGNLGFRNLGPNAKIKDKSNVESEFLKMRLSFEDRSYFLIRISKRNLKFEERQKDLFYSRINTCASVFEQMWLIAFEITV